MFNAPNLIPVAPFPLKSLPIQPHEATAAREASDTIYELAVETPWLRWLIEPEALWMKRAMVIGSFAFGKFGAVQAELAHRQAAARETSRASTAAPAPSPAANDNASDSEPPDPNRPRADKPMVHTI